MSKKKKIKWEKTKSKNTKKVKKTKIEKPTKKVEIKKKPITQKQYTKISELSRGCNGVNITLKIDFLGDKKRTQGYGDSSYMQAFLTDDEGGEIQMTFWNQQIPKAMKAKYVKVTNGYVSEYMGQLQLRCKEENPPEFLKKNE